jgi:hypothetical protein
VFKMDNSGRDCPKCGRHYSSEECPYCESDKLVDKNKKNKGCLIIGIIIVALIVGTLIFLQISNMRFRNNLYRRNTGSVTTTYEKQESKIGSKEPIDFDTNAPYQVL